MQPALKPEAKFVVTRSIPMPSVIESPAERWMYFTTRSPSNSVLPVGEDGLSPNEIAASPRSISPRSPGHCRAKSVLVTFPAKNNVRLLGTHQILADQYSRLCILGCAPLDTLSIRQSYHRYLTHVQSESHGGTSSRCRELSASSVVGGGYRMSIQTRRHGHRPVAIFLVQSTRSVPGLSWGSQTGS